jgi:hypothetical protein
VFTELNFAFRLRVEVGDFTFMLFFFEPKYESFGALGMVVVALRVF